MNRILGVFAGLLLMTSSAHASTQIFFKEDGSMANVLLFGLPGDLDASGLYNALKMAPTDTQGKWAKEFDYSTADGTKALDIVCVFSKVVANSGTCNVTFHKIPGVVEVDASSGKAGLTLSGDAAAALAAQFTVPASGAIYQSKDGRLVFGAQLSSDDARVEGFNADWH